MRAFPAARPRGPQERQGTTKGQAKAPFDRPGVVGAALEEGETGGRTEGEKAKQTTEIFELFLAKQTPFFFAFC